MIEDNKNPKPEPDDEQSLQEELSVPDSVQNEAPKSKKPLIMLVILLIVVLSGGIFGWKLMSNNKDKQATTNKDLRKSIKTAPNILTSDINDRLTFTPEENLPGLVMFFYAPTKRNVYVQQDKSLSYALKAKLKNAATRPVTQDELRKSAQDKIVSEGYTAYQEPGGVYLNKSETDNKIGRYKKGTIVCTVNVDDIAGNGSMYSLSRTCANADNLQAAAQAIEPFYVAYESSSYYKGLAPNLRDEKNAAYAINISTIKPSELTGYEYATGGIGGFDGGANIEYYRKTGGDWHFAFVTQSVLDCASFDNIDMQKALSHDSCYPPNDINTATTVKAYYKL